MNFSTVAMLLLAWQLLKSQNTEKQRKPDLTEFLSDETKNVIECVNKLSTKNTSGDDKMGAIFQIVSNPTIMGLLQNLLAKKDEKSAQNEEKSAQNETHIDDLTNEEGYSFEKPSDACREFFRPIDNIADAEVKHKLYWFYDNWYVK